MTESKETGRSARAFWLGGAALAVAAAGALWLGRPLPAPAPAPAATAPAPAPVAPAPATSDVALGGTAPTDAAPAPGAKAQSGPDAAAPAAAADTPAQPPADAAPSVPSFDVVRVGPDGNAVVAGQAEPKSSVRIRIDGEEVAQSAAGDGQGKFVALFTLPPSAAPRVVTLMSVLPDGRQFVSADSVIIAPTQAPIATAEAELPPTADAGTAEAPVPADSGSAAAAANGMTGADLATAAVQAALAPEAEPPAALLVTDGGAKVLQGAGNDAADTRNVTIDAISYSAAGDVQLSGRGGTGGFVRLYLDNQALMDAQIGPDGSWAGTMPSVAAGIYTLRADQISATGTVQSRYETPFQRESPEVLAAASPVAGGSGELPLAAKITVQPGFTLWGIARQNYGSGVMYVQVYEANKAMIRDPDLIYPGQVFNVPARQ